MRFADMHLCKDLVNASHSYIEQYFADVVCSEEFMQLECWQVIEFISSDRLTVSSEEKVRFNYSEYVFYERFLLIMMIFAITD